MNPPRSTLPAPALELLCHPASPWQPPYRLTVSLAAAGSEEGPGALLQYRLSGPTADLRWPAPATPGPADGLWQRTCFEAFVAVPGASAYREFNFSPSGQWAAYRFQAEREPEATSEITASPEGGIAIDSEYATDGLLLQAWVPMHLLPPAPAQEDLLWGLSAVLEHQDGRLSYWALTHPQPQPDFHHPAGRSLVLRWPRLNLPT